jgi:dual specificity MAP kinase phosphatase
MNEQNQDRSDDEIIESLQIQNPAKILPNLYLSSVDPAQNLVLLKKLKINFILNLTGYKHNSNELRYPMTYPPEISILHIKINDEIDTKITNYLNQALDFIHNSLSSNNSNKILIHCEAGISRSSTIVIAYLIKYKNKSLNDAYQYVKQCKKNIAPNINFFNELIQFEKEFNNNSLQPSISLNEYIIEQMSDGMASQFSRHDIIDALEKTNYDLNKATNLLFDKID